MPPGSANTTEEGGKDTSIHFKISSPARFYNICSNHYLKHCTNLHILYCYPERVFFPPESSSFSEGNRLGNSPSNQSSQAQICTCEKIASQISVCTLGEAAVYHFSHSCLSNHPGVSTGPITNQAKGQPAQPVNLVQ